MRSHFGLRGLERTCYSGRARERAPSAPLKANSAVDAPMGDNMTASENTGFHPSQK